MSVTRIKTNILCYHEDGSVTHKIECYGKTTDTKPTDVPNATPFYEMDNIVNGKPRVYMFDVDDKTWILQNG